MKIIKTNIEENIVMVTFRKKRYCKSNVVLPLSIINPLLRSLESMHILESLVSLPC